MTHLLAEPSPLERYGHNLTQLARQGVFSPLAGSETIVTRIFEILLRRVNSTKRYQYNPLVLDMAGTSRWPVIAEVIRRMAAGDAPDPLPTWQVIALNYEALLARTPEEEAAFKLPEPEPAPPEEEDDPALDEMDPWDALEYLFKKYFPKGLWPPLEEWAAPNVVMQRLQAIFLAVRQSEGQVLLFIDHFHRLLGGEPKRYPIHAFTLLKPTLARGEIQLIGACTLAEFRQWVERDEALRCRWQPVCLPDTRDELERLRAQRDSKQQP